MTIWWKIAAVLGIITIIFTSGMCTEYKFHLASLEKQEQKQVVKAQEGQNKIIEFNQQIKKIYVKVNAPCITTTMPDDVISVLK